MANALFRRISYLEYIFCLRQGQSVQYPYIENISVSLRMISLGRFVLHSFYCLQYMNIKRLIQTTTFEQLISSDLTATQTRAVCDSLIENVIRLSDTEKDPQSLFRTLCYTRFHLQTICEKSGLTTEMGKKCIRAAIRH